MVLDKLKENETLMNAIDNFVKVTTMGGLIIGTLLVLEKIFGLTFDISIGLGL